MLYTLFRVEFFDISGLLIKPKLCPINYGENQSIAELKDHYTRVPAVATSGVRPIDAVIKTSQLGILP